VLGFRVSAWARRDGGWINSVDVNTLGVTDRNANRTDTYVLRAALAWAPTSNLLITPSIEYQKRDEHNNGVYWTALSNPSSGSYRDATPDRMADPDDFYLPSLKIDYDLGPVKLISNTSYYDRKEHVNGYSGTLYDLSYFQHFTNAGTDPQGVACGANCLGLYPLLTPTGPNLPGFGSYFAQNWIVNSQQNFTQEVRLQSNIPASRLNWTAGVFFSRNSQRSTETIYDPQLPALTQYLWGEDMITAWGENLLPNGIDYINDTKAHDQQVALFADGTYNITDKLKLNLGVRYAWTHFDYNNLNDGPQDLLDSGGVPATAKGKKNETPFTPKISVSYQLTHDDMIYATVSKGYRIGGATPPLPPVACNGTFPTQYNSDTVLNYEVGGKGRFLDRRLQIAASAYYIQWTNIQQAVYVSYCGIQYTTNVGDATSEGFDLQSQLKVSDHFNLEWTVGYTDAQYSKDAPDPSNPGFYLAKKGDALDVTPVTATVGGEYSFSLYGHDGYLRADYEFASRRTRTLPGENPITFLSGPNAGLNEESNYDGGLV